jgi:hypothetical protein
VRYKIFGDTEAALMGEEDLLVEERGDREVVIEKASRLPVRLGGGVRKQRRLCGGGKRGLSRVLSRPSGTPSPTLGEYGQEERRTRLALGRWEGGFSPMPGPI